MYKFLGTLLMLLPVISSLSQTYSFTSAGASGINGPSQAQVTAAYNASTLAGQVTVVGTGIQRWVVPSTGIYAITVAGASGGYTPGAAGGKGRLITINYSLTAGTVLDILVGQEGGRASFNTPGYAGGGGGGSFVVNGSNNSPILISGGGGGAAQGGGSFVSVQPGVDASAYNVTSGANGTGFSNSWAQVGIGGVNGGGGTNPGGYGGSGGGGFLGAGVQQYYGGYPGNAYSSSGMSGGGNRDWYGGFASTIPGGFGGGAGAGVHSNYEANALKYAFPNGQPGILSIQVSDETERGYTVIVHDNGVGLPAGFDAAQSGSLGFRIIKELTRQLRGQYEYTSGPGTTFTLQFPNSNLRNKRNS